MIALTLFNTETRKKEEFTPLKGKKVRMYTCGPTVYNYAHIGNFRTYVFEDVLRRVIKYFGFEIEQVMNVTDVEDKTIRGAIQNKESLADYTKRYKEAFFEDLKTLKIEKVEHYPEATAYIDKMIQLIETLIQKGIAYQDSIGNVYFSIHKFPKYGRLSHLKRDELKAGASNRVAADEYDKDSICDFVLWKAYDKERDGQIYWQSPFGLGRPGWHIECSAMAMDLLGESIDIHVGGVDNMFPHHENEIAQCEACTGKPFVRYWLHCEHLLVNNKKMSKSLGNFFTLRDLLEKGYSGQVVRLALLAAHYRTQLNFTMQGLQAALASHERLKDCILRLRQISQEKGQEIGPLIAKTKEAFQKALADDLNLSEAQAALFDLVRETNSLCDSQSLSQKGAEKILALFTEIDSVLGILPLQEEEQPLPEELVQALKKREKAREEKNWKEADHWRDFILEKNYLIEDTPKGPRLKKKVIHE